MSDRCGAFIIMRLCAISMYSQGPEHGNITNGRSHVHPLVEKDLTLPEVTKFLLGFEIQSPKTRSAWEYVLETMQDIGQSALTT